MADGNFTMTTAVPEITTKISGMEFDMETAERMHFVTSTIFGTIFVVVGLVGNVLSILVWKRENMRSSTGTYLIGQAIADMGLLLFFFLTDSIPMMQPEVKKSYAFGVFHSYIGFPIFFLFVICSIWITVGVTVDRYIQVCWISEAKKMCNTRRALTGLGIIIFLCFIINIPHFATYVPVRDSNRNLTTDDAFKPTEYGAGEGSARYEFWVHCMFLVLAPWATIFVLNMLIIREVTNVNRKLNDRRSLEGSMKAKKSEAQITRILLTVTFTFLVLIALQCITQCFFMLKTGNRRIVSEAFSIAKLGVVINSSINFFLYCMSGKRFRKELRVVVCGPFRSRAHGSSSFSMSHTSSATVTNTKSALPT